LGSVLGAEHAARQPAGLKKFIPEGGQTAAELTIQRQIQCWKSLGETYCEAVVQHDQDGINTELYAEARQLFFAQFWC